MGNQTTKSPFDVQILAARLKDLMRESVPKVTQKDLAATLGTAPNMVSAYMHGKSCPSLPMAVNIAQYFDVSIDYLAGVLDCVGKYTELFERFNLFFRRRSTFPPKCRDIA